MKNVFLFVVTVLIWGSTWFAVKFQINAAPIIVSLTYRFGIAALFMWLFCLVKNIPLRFSLRDHLFIFLLAITTFGINYILTYWAQKYIISAVAAIVFSTMTLINMVNVRLFFGRNIKPKMWLGSIIGVIGLALFFSQHLQEQHYSNSFIFGVSICFIGALSASLGNMISLRNSAKQLNVLPVNAWAMLYGSIFFALVGIVQGVSFHLPIEQNYLLSLFYLSIFGTLIAFSCYFILLHEITPEKASYAMVLFPIVAIALSTRYENFIWSTTVIAGFVLVLIGNALVISPKRRQP